MRLPAAKAMSARRSSRATADSHGFSRSSWDVFERVSVRLASQRFRQFHELHELRPVSIQTGAPEFPRESGGLSVRGGPAVVRVPQQHAELRDRWGKAD